MGVVGPVSRWFEQTVNVRLDTVGRVSGRNDTERYRPTLIPYRFSKPQLFHLKGGFWSFALNIMKVDFLSGMGMFRARPFRG